MKFYSPFFAIFSFLLLFSSCDFATTLLNNQMVCSHSKLIANTDGTLLYCDRCGLDFSQVSNEEINEALNDFSTLVVDCSNSGTVINSSFSKYSVAKEIIFEEGITQIKNYAFRDFNNLVEIQFPNSLLEISERAFYNCESLKECEIPEGVVTLFAGPFEGCVSLTSIKIPSSVRELNAAIIDYTNPFLTDEEIGVFQGCTSLRSVVFEENSSLEKIDAWSFRNCSYLNEFAIPLSVSFIGKEAFGNCKNLRVVTYEGSESEWESIKKESNWNLNSITKVVCQNNTPEDPLDDIEIYL